MGGARNGGIPRRVRSRVDELPPEGREKLDRMLNDPDTYWTYQEISEALAEDGLTISKSAIGRYVMRTNREMREITLMVREQEALLQWMKDNPNYDAAQASLALLISRLSSRIINEPLLVDEISPDKMIGHVIRAVRASTQMERLNQVEGKASTEARERVLEEVREAIQHDPELYDRLLVVVSKGGVENG